MGITNNIIIQMMHAQTNKKLLNCNHFIKSKLNEKIFIKFKLTDTFYLYLHVCVYNSLIAQKARPKS